MLGFAMDAAAVGPEPERVGTVVGVIAHGWETAGRKVVGCDADENCR